MSFRETLGWLLLAVVLIAARLLPDLRPLVANDSAMYLSVAENLRDGHGASTSIVHFDAERSFGRLPAPSVTFPPGYSAVIAAAARLTGTSLESVGLAVSALSMAAVLWLTLALCAQWDLPLPARRVVAFLFLLNTGFVGFATAVASEPAFIVCSMAFCVGYVSSLGSRSLARALAMAVLAGLALGVAYWMRYAGLFFAVGLAAVFVVQVLRRRLGEAVRTAAAGAAGAVLVLIGLWRNVQLVGNWRGGNGKAVFNDPVELAKTAVKTLDHLALGENVFRTTLVLRGVLGLVLLALGVLLWRARHRAANPATSAAPRERPAGLLELVVVLTTYSLLMLYAGLTTVISFGARMYFPVLPLALVLAAMLVARNAPRWGWRSMAPSLRATGVAALALYATVNVVDAWHSPLQENQERVLSRLDAKDEAGRSLRDVVMARVPEGEAIVANDAQMTGYLLHRPTLSLVEPHFTDIEWSEAEVRALMARFRARVLILSLPTARDSESDLLPSPFLRDLTRGKVPGWLVPLAQSASAQAYSLKD